MPPQYYQPQSAKMNPSAQIYYGQQQPGLFQMQQQQHLAMSGQFLPGQVSILGSSQAEGSMVNGPPPGIAKNDFLSKQSLEPEPSAGKKSHMNSHRFDGDETSGGLAERPEFNRQQSMPAGQQGPQRTDYADFYKKQQITDFELGLLKGDSFKKTSSPIYMHQSAVKGQGKDFALDAQMKSCLINASKDISRISSGEMSYSEKHRLRSLWNKDAGSGTSSKDSPTIPIGDLPRKDSIKSPASLAYDSPNFSMKAKRLPLGQRDLVSPLILHGKTTNCLQFTNYSEKFLSQKNSIGSFNIREDKNGATGQKFAVGHPKPKMTLITKGLAQGHQPKSMFNTGLQKKCSFPDIDNLLSPTLIREIEDKEKLERRKELLQSSPNLKDLAGRMFDIPSDQDS
jgi:hypothetical protein